MTPPRDTPPADLTAGQKCTATAKRSGKRCTHWPMRGSTVCAQHGGKAPQVMAAAERRIVEAEASAIVRRLLADPDAEPVYDPAWELARVAGRMGNAVDVLGVRVNELDEAGRLEYTDANLVRRLHVLVEAWKELMVEYRKTLTDMTRLGIEARTAARLEDRVQELHGAALARVIGRLLDGLQLTAEQRALVPTVVPGVLLEIAGEAAP
ncbi:hypothetical protein ACIBQX_18875 [Nonomuraea sp. NPDC049714]|uniref:hypothetical protein n=1 Tax=Nonomuraea sp. NPDC049714 TaxID=3364357 RepID=UPI0037AC3EB1